MILDAKIMLITSPTERQTSRKSDNPTYKQIRQIDRYQAGR